jgi:hypothetical protein
MLARTCKGRSTFYPLWMEAPSPLFGKSVFPGLQIPIQREKMESTMAARNPLRVSLTVHSSSSLQVYFCIFFMVVTVLNAKWPGI